MEEMQCMKGCHIVPCLSVPVERHEVLGKVLNLLKKRRLIRTFDLQETERVAVARITY